MAHVEIHAKDIRKEHARMYKEVHSIAQRYGEDSKAILWMMVHKYLMDFSLDHFDVVRSDYPKEYEWLNDPDNEDVFPSFGYAQKLLKSPDRVRISIEKQKDKGKDETNDEVEQLLDFKVIVLGEQAPTFNIDRDQEMYIHLSNPMVKVRGYKSVLSDAATNTLSVHPEKKTYAPQLVRELVEMLDRQGDSNSMILRPEYADRYAALFETGSVLSLTAAKAGLRWDSERRADGGFKFWLS